MRKVRVLHISTAHPAQDPRIVFKQCQTLAEQYEVFCALPHANATVVPHIHFIRLPYFRHVIWRLLLTSPLIFIRGIWLRPRLIHVYVPEFIPFAFIFHLLGTQVVYEVQENLHKKMHLKAINNGFWLKQGFRWFDRLAQRHFYLIFTEHGYLDTYTAIRKPHAVIYNYPLLSFLEPYRQTYQPDSLYPSFFYIGWISFERAFDTLIDSLALLKPAYPNFVMHLFGRRTFTDAHLKKLPNFAAVHDNIHFYGYTDQRAAFPYAGRATAGLALLKPVGDYPDSYTTKLFEYMALGLPVVTSDFPLYKDIVERHRCGFCVSPNEPVQVADALRYLIEHPDEAKVMGQRGRLAIEQCHNWSSEAKKLMGFYECIFQQSSNP